MKLRVFYVYFKFFIWLFLITTIIDAFCILNDPISCFIVFIQDFIVACVFMHAYKSLELPDDCKTWKEYYESLLELKKQGMTKEDKKIIELFIPPD